MEANWFEAKVKLTRLDEYGREKKVVETYLVDAVSYTEAEARMVEEMDVIASGDFHITGLKPSRISEVLEPCGIEGGKWFLGFVDIIDTITPAGKEKRVRKRILVPGRNIDEALDNLRKETDVYLVPAEIAGVRDSAVAAIFIEEQGIRHEMDS